MSIIVDNISYTYEIGTGFEKQALKNVKCVINDGDFIGLIGHTGSGKSTFIQHLNGLVKATSGTIYFNGMDIYDKDFDMKMLRSKVGSEENTGRTLQGGVGVPVSGISAV